MAVTTVVLFGYPTVGFPAMSADLIQINVYVRFLGYAFGSLTVYISLVVD